MGEPITPAQMPSRAEKVAQEPERTTNPLYEEVGRNYRFFLAWRHAAFAGNLVVIYGVASLTISIFQKMPGSAWLIPLIGSPIGLLLWIIDVRTRDLYHAAIDAGEALEAGRPGFYTQLRPAVVPKGAGLVRKPWVTHSGALDIFFLSSAVVMALAALLLAFAI